LKDSNVSPKVETIKENGVGERSLVCNTSKVEGCARASGWGLRQMINGSVIHMNMHKLNNKLVNAWLEHF